MYIYRGIFKRLQPSIYKFKWKFNRNNQ